MELIESKDVFNKQNLSKQEFSALHCLLEKKNDKYIINDSDKNLGAAAAEKTMLLWNVKDNCMT